jgi:hypothetical protein
MVLITTSAGIAMKIFPLEQTLLQNDVRMVTLRVHELKVQKKSTFYLSATHATRMQQVMEEAAGTS